MDGDDDPVHGPTAPVPGVQDLLWRWPTTEVRRILAGLFALVAAAALVVVVVGTVRDADEVRVLQQRGATAEAVITGAVPGRVTTARIEFTGSGGQRVEVSGIGVPGPVRTGRVVRVVYDPRDPQVVRTPAQLGPAGLVAGSALSAVLGVLLLVQLLRVTRPPDGWRREGG